MAHFNSIARNHSKTKRHRADKEKLHKKLLDQKKRGRPPGMGGSLGKQRVSANREHRPRKIRTANDILNARSPVKKERNINPYGPGGALYDRTMSVNYDAEKEKRVRDLKERLKEIERLKMEACKENQL